MPHPALQMGMPILMDIEAFPGRASLRMNETLRRDGTHVDAA